MRVEDVARGLARSVSGGVWVAVVAGAAAVALLVSASSAFAGQGDVNTSFGTNGVTLTAVGSNGNGATGIVRETDGSYAVAGSGLDSLGKYAPVVAHYTSAGKPDTSFGSNGVAKLPTESGKVLYQPSVAYQEATGDLVVAGTWVDPSSVYQPGDFGLVRLKPDGSLDTSFGTGGAVDTKIGNPGGDAYAVAVDATSGEIYVGGDAQPSPSSSTAFVLAAYAANGTLARSFGSYGIKFTTFSAGVGGQISALSLYQSKLVAAGSVYSNTSGQVAVMRYSATSGSPDTTFHGGTPALLSVGTGAYAGGYAVVVQSSGKIVVGGYASYNGGGCQALLRLGADGSLDASFGSAGIAHLCVGQDGSAYGLASDGTHLYAAGNTLDASNQNHLLLSRWSADGVLDTTFGHSGDVVADPAGSANDSYANGIALDGALNPVVAGQAHDKAAGKEYFMLASYLGAGSAVAPPTLTSPPKFTGTLAPGKTLTANAGYWKGSPAYYDFRWLRCPSAKTPPTGCTDDKVDNHVHIPADTYTLQTGDGGHYIVLEVTAVNLGGSGVGYATGGPVQTSPTNTVSPSISGRALVGTTLGGTAGTWTGPTSRYNYIWLRCPTTDLPPVHCTDDRVETDDPAASDMYRVQPADAGSYLVLEVKGINDAGYDIAYSAWTDKISVPPVAPSNVDRPSVEGPSHLRIGDTLTGKTGTWQGTQPITFSYGWLRCRPGDTAISDCTAIGTSSSPDYTVQQADYGYMLLFVVIASNAAGASEAWPPSFTSPVDDKAATIQTETQTAQKAGDQVQNPPPARDILAGGGSSSSLIDTITVPNPGIVTIAYIGEVTGGNVIAAGGGNVIAAGGGNVIAAGGGNVIAAGGGNVIAAGGGNVIAPGGGNLAHFAARSGIKKVKLVALVKGRHKFGKAGSGKVRLRLTNAGHKLLKAWEKKAKKARRHHKKIRPIRIGIVTLVSPLHGNGPAVYSVRMVKLRP